MRKFLSFTVAIILIFSLTACNNTVELKIPSAVLNDEGDITLDEYASENGFISVTQASSLFLDVVMTKSRHRELVRESEKYVDERYSGIVKAENTDYIKKITHDEDFRSITVEVDKAGYETVSLDMNIHQIGLLAIMHQIYTGLQQNAEVIVKDTVTNVTLSITSYPDAIAPD